MEGKSLDQEQGSIVVRREMKPLQWKCFRQEKDESNPLYRNYFHLSALIFTKDEKRTFISLDPVSIC